MRRYVIGAAIAAVLGVVGAGGLASAKAKAKPKAAKDVAPAEAAPEPFDVTAGKAKFIVLADGKGHYVVTAPTATDEANGWMFWSTDGKAFHRMRGNTAGKNGDDWSRGFWEPRYADIEAWRATVDFRGGKYSVQCDERVTALTRLPDKDARAVIDGAQFFTPLFNRYPYALARDDKGTYYYVDTAYEPPKSKNFRLYVGPKGNLALTKLVNVVSDSEGDIFSTKKGELRLVLNKSEARWIKGKKDTPLTYVPVDSNIPMIFNELGIYSGAPLGTPCDEL